MYFGIKDIVNETVSGIPDKEILEAVNKIIENTNINEVKDTK